VVEQALSATSFLSAEQQLLVRRLARAGDGVAVVVGTAGIDAALRTTPPRSDLP